MHHFFFFFVMTTPINFFSDRLRMRLRLLKKINKMQKIFVVYSRFVLCVIIVDTAVILRL